MTLQQTTIESSNMLQVLSQKCRSRSFRYDKDNLVMLQFYRSLSTREQLYDFIFDKFCRINESEGSIFSKLKREYISAVQMKDRLLWAQKVEIELNRWFDFILDIELNNKFNNCLRYTDYDVDMIIALTDLIEIISQMNGDDDMYEYKCSSCSKRENY